MSQAQLLPTEHFSPSVSLIDNRPATTSLAIAEHFGKRHDHVCRDIRRICSETPEEFHIPNFGEMFRTVKIGNGAEREELYFTVFFDGFILLVMGYTGKKALGMKLAYIAKFNEMKEQLDKLAMEERARAAADVKALPGVTITPEQQAQLKAIVDAKVGMLPATVQRKAFAEIWSRFGRHFQIARYVQLPAERMGDAVEYLVGMELRTGKAALPERTAPELSPAPRRDAPAVLKVTERECQALTDDITRAHIEVMRLLKPVKDRLSNISLRLAIETEQRAGMRALRHGEGESLQGMLFAGTGRMFAEAVMYPNEYELPVYCNPGFFLLGICRQLRAGGGA